jgi:N-acetylmuramoyl-L-alanine amidase
MPGGGTMAQGLTERARISNEAKAKAFVSCHFNASPNPAAAGIWILYANGSGRGRDFAEAIQRELGGRVFPDKSGWTGNRRLAVLWQTAAPAVLIEWGFLTNEHERNALTDVEVMRDLISKAARGIAMWLD